ncbi:MAG: GntR family transcriptional regulator [Desulfuromusa sp.]|jgi:DNA-binding FadR family transcriptional regulator|nr:GntR family transcriptional regulator [Desulfuromusa sp.]
MTKESLLENNLLMKITSDNLSVGDRLPSERQMAVNFNVSRNTLRSALRRLETKGVITSRRGSGYYLTDNSQQAYHFSAPDDSFERIMARLEAAYLFLPGVISIAVEQITDEQLLELENCTISLSRSIFDQNITEFKQQARTFFQIIASSTKNPIIIEMVSAFCASSSQLFPGFFSFDETQQEKLFGDYVHIFNALKKRDKEASMLCVMKKVINTCCVLSELKEIPLPTTISSAREALALK